MNNSSKLVIAVFLSLVLAVFIAPQYVDWGVDFANAKLKLSLPHMWNVPFSLGLDLLGGTHLLYEADLSKLGDASPTDAMQGVRDVIERRVNFFGVAEPIVQVSGKNRLIVELAGISDVNQAIQLIGETPQLEFKTTLPVADGNAIIQEALKDVPADNPLKKANLTAEILCLQQNVDALSQFIMSTGLDPCYRPSGLTGSHLKRAQVIFNSQSYQPQVSLELSGDGGKLFAQITKDNIGKIVAIYLDGLPINVPTVQSEIPDGQAIITGMTAEGAKMLSIRMNSGALPVPVKLISQATIGAPLGAESLSKSLTAGLWGFILVAVYMILFYRLPGIVADFALVVYGLIVLTIYKLVPVTLSLAGIAGFILSLGMAVDANILIFARLKEELKAGKSLGQAAHEGFRRAWLSIRDGHMTTLIGAVILYIFTTSMVKGFALTLGIGVLTSLFTATVVTRIFLLATIRPSVEKHKWLFG